MCDMIYLVRESISTVGFKIVPFTEKWKIVLVLFQGYPPITSIIIGTRVWATSQTDSEVFLDENSIKGIRYDSLFCQSYRNLCNFFVFENKKFWPFTESNSWQMSCRFSISPLGHYYTQRQSNYGKFIPIGLAIFICWIFENFQIICKVIVILPKSS